MAAITAISLTVYFVKTSLIPRHSMEKTMIILYSVLPE